MLLFRPRNRHGFAGVQYVGRNETDLLGDENEFDENVHVWIVILLHVLIENVQELAVDHVEIFADNDADFAGFHRDDVDDLEKEFVPDDFGIAAQEGHVDFVVDVADAVGVGLFFGFDRHFFFVF